MVFEISCCIVKNLWTERRTDTQTDIDEPITTYHMHAYYCCPYGTVGVYQVVGVGIKCLSLLLLCHVARFGDQSANTSLITVCNF